MDTSKNAPTEPAERNTIKFPENFIWGTATSAHQTEGNNTNSDWWHYEKNKGNKYFPRQESGQACDSYNRYEEDFTLCQQLNNNAVRISIEWARIEPEENQFNQQEIQHYRKVLESARQKGLKTFVTLHHFTNPYWFYKKGGWANLRSPYYFTKYAKYCAQELGDLIDHFITINEPQVYTLMSYVLGIWPPAKKNVFSSLLVQINMLRSHIKTYKAIKKLNRNHQVGLVKNIVWFYPAEDSKIKLLDFILSKILFWLNSDFFLLPSNLFADFIGVNYYFTNRIRHLKRANLDNRQSDLNWWIVPEGLKQVLLNLKKYNQPIYITENGLADAWDNQRKEFIRDMLKSCWEAVEQDAPLKGYFHWSLLDNFEWHEGFGPRFGIVEVDYMNDFKRTPRPSFYYYADICKNNGFTV